MPIAIEGQVQAYWRTCRDLRVARETGDSAEAEAAYEELADLAVFTNRPNLRAACLSHLRCEVIAAAKLSLFVMVFLLAWVFWIDRALPQDYAETAGVSRFQTYFLPYSLAARRVEGYAR